MIRIGTLAAVLFVAAACGSVQGGTGSTVPPGATASTAAATTRLMLGSYCWSAPNTRVCADTGDPAEIKGLPVVGAAAGETIVVRLGFDPTQRVQVSIGKDDYRVDPARVLRLHVTHPGLLVLFSRHGDDDVSYYGRIRLSA
jgi:hypothetical protein